MAPASAGGAGPMDGERRPAGMRSLRHSVVVGTAALCAVVLFVVADHPKKSGEIALFSSSSWSSRGNEVGTARRAVEEDVRRLEKDLALLKAPHSRKEEGRNDQGDDLERAEMKARQARLSDDVERKEKGEDAEVPFHRMFEESQRHHESALHRLDKATRHLLDKWLRVDAARKDRSEDGGEPRERTSKRGVAEFDIKLGGSEGSRGVRDERREDRTEDEPRGETRVARKEEEALSLLDKEYEAKKRALERVMQKHATESGERRQRAGEEREREAEREQTSAERRRREEDEARARRERSGEEDERARGGEREGEERGDAAVGGESRRYYEGGSEDQQLTAYPYSASLAAAQAPLPSLASSPLQPGPLASSSAGPAASESLAGVPAPRQASLKARTQELTWPPPSPSTVPRGAFKDKTIYDSDYNWPSELQVATGDEWKQQGDCGMFGGNC